VGKREDADGKQSGAVGTGGEDERFEVAGAGFPEEVAGEWRDGPVGGLGIEKCDAGPAWRYYPNCFQHSGVHPVLSLT
jgi:hypothetical protein